MKTNFQSYYYNLYMYVCCVTARQTWVYLTHRHLMVALYSFCHGNRPPWLV